MFLRQRLFLAVDGEFTVPAYLTRVLLPIDEERKDLHGGRSCHMQDNRRGGRFVRLSVEFHLDHLLVHTFQRLGKLCPTPHCRVIGVRGLLQFLCRNGLTLRNVKCPMKCSGMFDCLLYPLLCHQHFPPFFIPPPDSHVCMAFAIFAANFGSIGLSCIFCPVGVCIT